MVLMGFSMRYPRFLVVLFVALGLAALAATPAHATETGSLPDALRRIETLADISEQAAAGADLARRGVAVELLAEHVDLDHGEASRLLDAMMALAASMAGAGERVGVLESPDIDAVFALILEFVRSSDPHSAQVFAKADFLTERAIAVAELLAESELTAMDSLVSTEPPSVADPLERWRPLVEQYFAPERIDEALSIIDCESNGDPDARNPRSSASGLFQFLDRTWLHSSKQAGFQGASPFSPEANIAAAAWLVEYSLGTGDAPWAHWTCRP